MLGEVVIKSYCVTLIATTVIIKHSLATLQGVIQYIGNRPRKKKFANFVKLEAFANVFLYFLSLPEFLYMRLPEL